jgi:hypothetical protein
MEWKSEYDNLREKIPVTYLINPAIKLFKSQIERKIDEAVEKSMNFKPNVMEALEKFVNLFRWMRVMKAG